MEQSLRSNFQKGEKKSKEQDVYKSIVVVLRKIGVGCILYIKR